MANIMAGTPRPAPKSAPLDLASMIGDSRYKTNFPYPTQHYPKFALHIGYDDTVDVSRA
jgi:hypothetical protein